MDEHQIKRQLRTLAQMAAGYLLFPKDDAEKIEKSWWLWVLDRLSQYETRLVLAELVEHVASYEASVTSYRDYARRTVNPGTKASYQNMANSYVLHRDATRTVLAALERRLMELRRVESEALAMEETALLAALRAEDMPAEEGGTP